MHGSYFPAQINDMLSYILKAVCEVPLPAAHSVMKSHRQHEICMHIIDAQNVSGSVLKSEG